MSPTAAGSSRVTPIFLQPPIPGAPTAVPSFRFGGFSSWPTRSDCAAWVANAQPALICKSESPRQRGKVNHLELPLGLPSAKHFFVELADARFRDLGDEGPVLRHPPSPEPPGDKLAQCFGGNRRTRLSDDARQRSLAPFFVWGCDHRSLKHIRVGHQRVFDLHR